MCLLSICIAVTCCAQYVKPNVSISPCFLNSFSALNHCEGFTYASCENQTLCMDLLTATRTASYKHIRCSHHLIMVSVERLRATLPHH